MAREACAGSVPIVDRSAVAAVEGLFAPSRAVAAHPAVHAVSRIAHDTLAPHAAAADDPARGVEPAHVALLADTGLLSVGIPEAEGGVGGDPRVGIETVELLSGACGATWFVVTQHQMPQAVARGALGAGDRPRCGAASCRPGLRTGLRRHCRRPPAPPRAARRARGPRQRGLAPDGTSEVHRLGVDRRRDDRWHGTRRPHRPGPRAGP